MSGDGSEQTVLTCAARKSGPSSRNGQFQAAPCVRAVAARSLAVFNSFARPGALFWRPYDLAAQDCLLCERRRCAVRRVPELCSRTNGAAAKRSQVLSPVRSPAEVFLCENDLFQSRV